MKNYKLNINRKTKVIALIGAFIVACGITYSILRAINDWYATHTLQFNKMVEVKFQKPLEIKERVVETKEIVKVINEVKEPQDLETDAEKYIYEKFGIENYKVAIAVARAESGMREDAIGINTNNTIDVGIFQINQIHFKKDGCSLAEVSTIKGNVDCAYQIFEDQGWKPWVAFNTGRFISKLD